MYKKINHLKKQLVFLMLLLFLFIPTLSDAATIKEDKIEIIKATVVKASNLADREIPGTETTTKVQNLKVLLLEGESKGKTIHFENDYSVQLKDGETFYLRKVVFSGDGRELYTVADPYRINSIVIFTLIFIILVFVFGGKQGIRGLLSLTGSLFLIIFILLPGVINGHSPMVVSTIVASFIVILGSYITHGFNKTTSAAVVGMIFTILMVGVLAYFAVVNTNLTGFDTEESVYLNFNTHGSIDFVGLLLGGMLIGLLGVLYDAAIGQAVTVEELNKVAPHLSRVVIYKKAIRVGREHIGALVNTLAIAYVGVSLPLLLLVYLHNAPIIQVINRENFATEIIRTLIGSIGLVLAVPITTFIAVLFLIKKGNNKKVYGQNIESNNEIIKKEIEKLDHFTHSHS